MSEILQARNLSKSFGALRVTDDISFSLVQGSRLALIGPNGAGKSTLVGLLTGQIAPDAGRVLLAGRDVTNASPERRVRQGLVRTFQINNLFRELTVLENVFLAVSEHMGVARRSFLKPASRQREVLEVAADTLARLDLYDCRGEKVSSLPYGRQRLLEMAIALSLSPKVLLLDEPAAGIPSGEVQHLMDAIAALPEDLAIVMIEHDMDLVRRFASKVLVLVAGAVLAAGPPEEVMRRSDVLRVYLGGQSAVGRGSVHA